MKTRYRLSLLVLIFLLITSCGKNPDFPPRLDNSSTPSAPVVDQPPEEDGPSGLPPCAGLLRVEKKSGTPQVGTTALLSSQPVDSLLNSYTANLSADGWLLKTSVQQNRDHHLLFLRGDRFLRMQIGPSGESDGASRILLAWGQTTSARETSDAYEPDPEDEDKPDINRGSVEW